MRTLAAACLSVAVLLSLLPRAHAQEPPVTIDRVQLGFPTSANKNAGTVCKPGLWTPVYVEVTAGPEGFPRAVLTVETPDCDDLETRYTIKTRPLNKNEKAI